MSLLVDQKSLAEASEKVRRLYADLAAEKARADKAEALNADLLAALERARPAIRANAYFGGDDAETLLVIDAATAKAKGGAA